MVNGIYTGNYASETQAFFSRPHFLWALLLIIPAALLALRHYRRKRAALAAIVRLPESAEYRIRTALSVTAFQLGFAFAVIALA